MKTIRINRSQKISVVVKSAFLFLFGVCILLSCSTEKDKRTENKKSPSKYDWANEKKAIAEFTKVLEKDPNDFISLKGRAESLKDIGKYKKAIKDIELAMSINATDSETHRIKGEILKGLEDYTASIIELSKYIDENPNDPKGYFERAYSYERGRKIIDNETKSINDFKKAVELYSLPPSTKIDSFMQKSHIASTYFGLGLAYTQKGEFDSALEAFENSDKFSPNNKSTIRYIERLKSKI